MVSQAGVRNYERTGWAARQTQRKWGNVKRIQLLCATDHRDWNCPFFQINGSLDWFWTERGFSGTDVVMSDSFDPFAEKFEKEESAHLSEVWTLGLKVRYGGQVSDRLTLYNSLTN